MHARCCLSCGPGGFARDRRLHARYSGRALEGRRDALRNDSAGMYESLCDAIDAQWSSRESLARAGAGGAPSLGGEALRQCRRRARRRGSSHSNGIAQYADTLRIRSRSSSASGMPLRSRSRTSPSPTTSRCATPSTHRTRPVATPTSSSRRQPCQSLSALLTREYSSQACGKMELNGTQVRGNVGAPRWRLSQDSESGERSIYEQVHEEARLYKEHGRGIIDVHTPRARSRCLQPTPC